MPLHACLPIASLACQITMQTQGYQSVPSVKAAIKHICMHAALLTSNAFVHYPFDIEQHSYLCMSIFACLSTYVATYERTDFLQLTVLYVSQNLQSLQLLKATLVHYGILVAMGPL